MQGELMRIAVSGTHLIGKSTLIEDFIKKYPDYKYEIEPYYKLQDEKSGDWAPKANLDSFLEQLDYSIDELHTCAHEKNIIFDRCPVDFLAYILQELSREQLTIHDSEVLERLSDIKEALDTLDLIVFLPISRENPIEYAEENLPYRKAVDAWFKKLYRDEICDIFPGYNRPEVIEITGDRAARLKKLEHYIA
jgi:hypothetical protein